MNRYAGIGARKTPEDILKLMGSIGRVLSTRGYILRSGGADGADSAFYRGSQEGSTKVVEIYRARYAKAAWEELAAKHHPNWGACSPFTRKLMARNCAIILGTDLATPVEFVVCWTKGAKPVGGTGHSIRIAQAHNIPVHNLALLSNQEHFTKLTESE